MSYDIRYRLLGDPELGCEVALQRTIRIQSSYLGNLQERELCGRPTLLGFNDSQRQKESPILGGVHISVAKNDLRDSDLVYLEYCPQFSLRKVSSGIKATNVICHLIRKLGGWVEVPRIVFKAMPSSFLDHILRIIRVATKKKVLWSNTGGVIARMANQFSWQWSYSVADQVGNPVCWKVLPGRDVEKPSVPASASAGSDPYPATIFGFADLFPKADKILFGQLRQRSNFDIHGPSTEHSLKPVLTQQENLAYGI